MSREKKEKRSFNAIKQELIRLTGEQESILIVARDLM